MFTQNILYSQILYPSYSLFAIVKQVSNDTMLNGQIRKCIKLQVINKNWLLYWIEGIGDIYNTIWYTNQLGLSDVNKTIVCFSDSSGLVYKNFKLPCDSLVDYAELFEDIELFKTTVSIYPNPVSKNLFLDIKPENIKSIFIINAYGEIYYFDNKIPINVELLTSGLYILVIEYNQKMFFYQKFIKQ